MLKGQHKYKLKGKNSCKHKSGISKATELPVRHIANVDGGIKHGSW